MSEQAGIDRVEVVRIMPITIESPGVVSGLPLSPNLAQPMVVAVVMVK